MDDGQVKRDTEKKNKHNFIKINTSPSVIYQPHKQLWPWLLIFPSLIFCSAPWDKTASPHPLQSLRSFCFSAFPFTAIHMHMRAMGRPELRGHKPQQASQGFPAVCYRHDSSIGLTIERHRSGSGSGGLGSPFFAPLIPFQWHSVRCFPLPFLVRRSMTKMPLSLTLYSRVLECPLNPRLKRTLRRLKIVHLINRHL